MTPEGISDLRRYWNGRGDDFTGEELQAFFDTLPADSATRIKYSDYEVSLTDLLLATLLDTQRQAYYGSAGKRLGRDKLLVPSLSTEQVEKKTASRDRIARVKALFEAQKAAENPIT